MKDSLIVEIKLKTLWPKVKLLIMSNFTFGHNVFKSRLLLLRRNASAGGNGLLTPFKLRYGFLEHCSTKTFVNATVARWFASFSQLE